jgi:PKD repeat protein
MRGLHMPKIRHRKRSRGQSLVEFALLLPLLLLILMVGIDFGRVYLGYINLQNMVRIAANYAANNPTAWDLPLTPAKSATQASYKDQIINDAKATNCKLPVAGGVPVVPNPTFTDQDGDGDTDSIGDLAKVALTCQFRIVTPIISGIVGSGGNLGVSADAVFPVKSGMVSTGGGGGGPTLNANFTGSPRTGEHPLVVNFTDTSTGGAVSWEWDFENDGTIDSVEQNPSHTYEPGTYSVRLTVSDGTSSDDVLLPAYIGVSFSTADINFTANPVSGNMPLSVAFSNASTAPSTAWAWDFQNNGSVDSTAENPTFVYTAAGTYTVKLTITTATGPLTKTVTNMITVNTPLCIVPSFNGTSSSTAQATWTAAGFTTMVDFKQGNLPWTIQSQTITGGTSVFCGTPIRVSNNNNP